MSEFNINNEGPLTHLSPELMEGYAKGTLPEDIREKVQAYLQANPFEAEALEGLIGQPGLDLATDMAALEARLDAKITPQRHSQWPWWRMAAAVSILVLSGVVFYYFMPETTKTDGIALDQEIVNNQEKEATPKLDTTPGLIESESSGEQVNEEPIEIEQKREGNEGLTLLSDKPQGDLTTGIADNRDKPSEPVTGGDTSSPVTPSLSSAELLQVNEDYDQTLADDESLEESPRMARSTVPSKVEGQRQRDQGFLTLNDSLEIPYEYKVVVGKVTSSQTGGPVVGANIAIKGTNIVTISDQNGFFHFEAPVTAESLVTSNIGFGAQEVPISERSQIDVVLDEDRSELSEVVVAEKSKDAKRKTGQKYAPSNSAVAPAGTSEQEEASLQEALAPSNMRNYLLNHTIYPSKAKSIGVAGSVIVSFIVLADGSLVDFKILQKLGFGCDEEAVKVLQNGPAWTPAKIYGKNVPSAGRIEVKFPPNQE